MNARDTIRRGVETALDQLGLPEVEVAIEKPRDSEHGDYSCNVAMQLAKQVGRRPDELALEIAQVALEKIGSEVVRADNTNLVAGPGFINFTLTPGMVWENTKQVLLSGDGFGANDSLAGKKIMVEYTDPNPFKVFHIGHLMSNAIGEAIARLLETSGATVVRACYQGDVGLHVAKAMWGTLEHRDEFPGDGASLSEKTEYLGRVYVAGAQAYKENEAAKKRIDELNKIIFEESDPEIEQFYSRGRTWSLEHFEQLYKLLGTTFQHYFFESKVAERGLEVVRQQLSAGVFQESNGAVIFDGEPFGLHARVFINSLGLPTYEAKEIGLNYAKHNTESNLDQSIVITAVEQKDYMEVVLKALEQFEPEMAAKTKHITHGMMRFADGKMSSRTGNVVSGESLLEDMAKLAMDKSENNNEALAEQVAVAAIKYSVLKQSPGKNIVYDVEQALSFEGDSGPYLQYTYARIQSLLRKATGAGIAPLVDDDQESEYLDRLLIYCEEVLLRATQEYAPQLVAGYAIELAREFNSWYGNTRILDGDAPAHNLARSQAVGQVIKNCVQVLGIAVPSEM